jgi:hypothetical protein
MRKIKDVIIYFRDKIRSLPAFAAILVFGAMIIFIPVILALIILIFAVILLFTLISIPFGKVNIRVRTGSSSYEYTNKPPITDQQTTILRKDIKKLGEGN